ncbi:FecR family protein [Luteolibacter flavescens]|uniref:FecR family protein n=1 Tax=Luteolibacter flavescens TaxID=1859460 RepID=A0ABT3FMX6_9BACT|nr:FecR family protein [Luteolibacter flavescens]MCW1884616.1 FecR family protein [Luteolibacter flavescens]
MTPSPELRKLIDQLLAEGGLGKVETSRLEELLKAPAAMRYYTEVMAQEAMMAEALEGIEGTAKTPKIVRFPVKAATLAAAACVVFTLGFFSGRDNAESVLMPVKKHQSVQVTGLMGVEWGDAGAPQFTSGSVTAERVAFHTGLVELTYASGVRVTLEGPADFSVTDATSGNLASGKLVAYVPPGAEGFTVDYAQGKVVDLGTEFAMDVSGRQAEVGVFDGEIELHLPGDKPRSLFQDQAVIHREGLENRLRAVPLDREKFVRRMPARDFRWEVTSAGTRELEFDVSHLIWKPSDYRAIFKWMEGRDAIIIRNVELRRDGRAVSADTHTGVTGNLKLVSANVFGLDVKPGDFERGRWTLHVTVETYPRDDWASDRTVPVASVGLLQFEEGLVSTATASDFIGRWSYYNLGSQYVREFLPDGQVRLFVNGEERPAAFRGSYWEVSDGVLRVGVPSSPGVHERHALRDRNTLIFMSNPYGNATRVVDP